MKLRVGLGYDVHQLAEGYPLYVGGILLESIKGAVGHSDADVLLHSIIDAMLGAAALGDIGHHFPDNNPHLSGINSRSILHKAIGLIKKAKYTVNNIDSTIIAQEPRMSPYVPRMLENIARDAEISPGQVSIKSKTNEQLGFLGRGEGIAAQTVVLLSRTDGD